jgi:phage-related protein
MPTLPLAPEMGVRWEVEPRMTAAPFGDGYKETVFNGLNPFMRRGQLNFEARLVTQIDALEVFLEANAATGFDVVVSRERPGRFLAVRWQRTRQSANRASLAVDVEEIPAVIVLAATATPTFTPPPASYGEAQDVQMNCATPLARIHYTMVPASQLCPDPTEDSARYGGPIRIDTSMRFKAIAIAHGYGVSAIASALYTLTGTPAVAARWAPVSSGAPAAWASVPHV